MKDMENIANPVNAANRAEFRLGVFPLDHQALPAHTIRDTEAVKSKQRTEHFMPALLRQMTAVG